MRDTLLSFLFVISFGSLGQEICKHKDQKNCMLESTSDEKSDSMQKNINGKKLEICSTDPLTGYTRSGFCEYLPSDRGRHLVCAEVSEEFLRYTKSRGNDLSTPNLRYGFKGLRPGDRWCLCSSRFLEAQKSGINIKMIEAATNEQAWN